MFSDSISDYFEFVAAKYLRAVDANPKRSNQHEIGGLVDIGFKQYLGSPSKGEKTFFSARLVYMSDTEDATTSCDDTLTWYDSRTNPNRSAEYRLYYKSNPVTSLIGEGDFFLVGKRTDNSLLLVFCPAGSTTESQLRSIFGLNTVEEEHFNAGKISSRSLLLPVRLLLEDLGLVTAEKDTGNAKWLGELIKRFGGHDFPPTSDFSSLARKSLATEFDPVNDPDGTLMAWMDHEEFLFRIYERHLVQERLHQGFGDGGNDVDEFISYSLSVQNRRKSRVGHAFEGHLEHLFKKNGLLFERAKGKDKVTENNKKPDFIFPSFVHYHEPTYPASRLVMLGAKTTCKDRWRQVPSEANRIQRKHLITLELAISMAQTEEMRSANLQLVIPKANQASFLPEQQKSLQDVAGFISEVIEKTVL